ncbi:MAG TPA: hypothetical protein VL400_09820 [Polyangiaceae bacterium]|nr:hypothetical protein [Polyangiaceae bacterium]
MSGARAPVVVVIVDGLSGGSPDEGPSAIERALPKTFAMGRAARLVASGERVGGRDGEPLSAELAHRVLGTGRPQKTIRSRLEASSVDPTLAPPIEDVVTYASFRAGTVDDFMRLTERNACTVHVFGLVSDAAPERGASLASALVESLLDRELPVAFHAITDGRAMPAKSAWRCIEPIADLLERRGTFASITGSAFALDTTGDWDKTLAVYHALVMTASEDDEEPRHAPTPFEALQDLYDDGFDDHRFPPTRIGDFSGVYGQLSCDFAARQPEWQWNAEDVAIFALPSADRATQLVSVLTRRDLPDAIASRVMTRGRKVIAFDPTTLVSYARVPARPEIRALFADDGGPTIRSEAARAGRRVATIFEPASRALATFALEGGSDGESDSEEAKTAAEALARASELAKDHDLVLVSLSAFCEAVHAGGEGVRAALEDVDASLVALAEALGADGTLLVTSSHVAPLEPHPERGRASTGGDVPLLVVGRRASALGDTGTLLDFAPTVLDALGLDVSALPGASLLSKAAKDAERA